MSKHSLIHQPNLGQKLYDVRLEKGLTQLELREKSHVSVRTIQRIESGAVTPRTITIKILLEALDQDPDDWFKTNSKNDNRSSMGVLSMINLVGDDDAQLKNALTPAWIAGIIYLIMVVMEQGLIASSDFLNESYFLVGSLGVIKFIAAITFFIFTRGLLSLSLLFEIQLLKIAAYISMFFIAAMYLSEVGLMVYDQGTMEMAGVFRALSIVPLGFISILLGVGLLRLQDGMGRIAKVAGYLELIFGICYVTLVLSFIGLLLLIPLLVIEIVLLSKADQLSREGKL